MYVILGIAIFILLCINIFEHRKVINQSKEMDYISEKIESILQENGKEFIMISSESESVKKIVVGVNHLLERYYQNQIEYEKSHKIMSEVLTNVSHDLRTPLTVLKGYTEILQMKSKDTISNEEATNLIHKLDVKTQEIVRMINQFFSMAKLESGDMILNIQRMDIGRICRNIILEYYDLLEKQNFHVEIQIPDYPIWADVDQEALERILKNVVDNAMKYGVDGSFLGIIVQEINGEIVIKIEDHGAGIEMKEKEEIFNRTFTLNSSKERKYLGSGLGLAICRNLIKQMNGTIHVSSIPEKQTVFSIHLKG
ncbi:HAMP domain-containing histidine kinase [Tissierella carlieri]|uniref:sensor histidine kinase n=1 Tax=Tissierella carlieri TaxID=689904 RepID=UPI001C11E778|nr:HAMP domain-containing sensor histidine kinase [Tissierella carlieri]MBU5314375.1 HAMP domain-containing histidine kinase [Tissierella carlieri]